MFWGMLILLLVLGAVYYVRTFRTLKQSVPACPKCGTVMVKREGPYGEFLGMLPLSRVQGHAPPVHRRFVGMRVGQRHGHRGVAILLGIFLSVLSAAVPVRALECVPPETLLDRYAVIVEGRIRHIRPARMQNQLPGSQPQWVVLTVIRYYKGEGEAEFRFLFDGLGWAALPDVGSEIIVGLMHSPNVGYTAGPCSLLIPSVPTQAREAELHTQVRERFGPGVAPPLSQPSIRPFPLWGLFPLLGGCLLFLACRKKRKSAAHT